MRNLKKVAACLYVCLMLFFVSGCAADLPVIKENATQSPQRTTAPTQILSIEPAALYESVLTEKRIVSIVFEGYMPDSLMLEMVAILKKAEVPCVFFISGVDANEHPDIVKMIHDDGFDIGNYGMGAAKSMEKQDVNENLYQFKRSQELIELETGISPALFRCNGSVYTRELLQAAALSGLKAAIEPGAYLNHRSFKENGDALQFVQRLTRGTIITVKLGQELDRNEYDGDYVNMEQIAIDPPPFLSDDLEKIISSRYANVLSAVTWLLEALQSEGYEVLPLKELQDQAVTMFDAAAPLDAQMSAMLNPANYTLPKTEHPLGEPEHAPLKSATWDGIVLVGDIVTSGMGGYVDWRRQNSPDYMQGVQFLTADNFSIVTSLMHITATSGHPRLEGTKFSLEDALVKMKAKTLLLMPGRNDVFRYTPEKLLSNLKIQIYLIRQKIPNIQIALTSIPPSISNGSDINSNMRIFQFNLEIAKFCLQYNIPFIDIAFALKDDNGNLNALLCFDPDIEGIRLNDAGYERWLGFLLQHMPLTW